jgi:hypothetical protein
MNLLIDDVMEYIKNSISIFHEKRIAKIAALNLKEVLKKKNPYLFKVKYMRTAEEIIKDLLNAYISSSEETMFGDWLEGLAIFINQKVYSGWKSGIKGIDLEFDKKGIRYIASIKSGPNWGNSSQIRKYGKRFHYGKKNTTNKQFSNADYMYQWLLLRKGE